MLSTLHIQRIGVIDDALLEFGPGFTALTGETGAGKTMIVTGLTMLLGARLDRGRTGSSALVAGTITLDGHDELCSVLQEIGAETEDDEVLVVRKVTREGRSRAHIGGVPVPIGTLAAHVGSAVTVHGQSDQLRLRDADAQREALDRFAPQEILPARAAHEQAFSRCQELREQICHLQGLITERDQRGALLREALERLEAVDPQPGEDEQLRQDLEKLAGAADLRAAADQAALALAGDDGPAAGPLLDLAAEAVQRGARTDPALAPLADRLLAARDEVSDLAAELSRYADGIDAGPGRLDAANERLHELTVLLRDVGPMIPGADGPAEDIAGLLEASQQAAADLDRYDGAEEEMQQVQAALAEAEQDLETTAEALSAARTTAAERLAAEVQGELQALDMPGARIRVEVAPGAHRPHGRDIVTIELAPHLGADYRPVADAASGGELSRVMLALEVALASSRQDRTAAPVFVFDEIDAGIGGRAALAVGQRLQALARRAQVIVVTHLPQVAAHAGTHLRIVKTSADGETSSTVETLDRKARVRELARMLAGDDASDVALAHAEELLAEAHAEGESR